jgi:hypothetical protein
LGSERETRERGGDGDKRGGHGPIMLRNAATIARRAQWTVVHRKSAAS